LKLFPLEGKFWRHAGIPLVILVLLVLSSSTYYASPAAATSPPPPPNLGTAAGFGVLAGSAVTNTGSSVVGGNLGVSPGIAVTGFPPGTVAGTIHKNDAVAVQAKSDLASAYNAIAGDSCSTNLTGQNLGGLTLTPGVYCFSSAALLTGKLTLKAQGDNNALFVFKIGSALTTASGSSVVMAAGGTACGVFWQVGSSAVLGTDTAFNGTILALASISLGAGASVTGGALARNGAVTLDANHVGACPTAESQIPPFLENFMLAHRGYQGCLMGNVLNQSVAEVPCQTGNPPLDGPAHLSSQFNAASSTTRPKAAATNGAIPMPMSSVYSGVTTDCSVHCWAGAYTSLNDNYTYGYSLIPVPLPPTSSPGQYPGTDFGFTALTNNYPAFNQEQNTENDFIDQSGWFYGDGNSAICPSFGPCMFVELYGGFSLGSVRCDNPSTGFCGHMQPVNVGDLVVAKDYFDSGDDEWTAYAEDGTSSSSYYGDYLFTAVLESLVGDGETMPYIWETMEASVAFGTSNVALPAHFNFVEAFNSNAVQLDIWGTSAWLPNTVPIDTTNIQTSGTAVETCANSALACYDETNVTISTP